MIVVSTNISRPTAIAVNGKEEVTGYYKTPANFIVLKKEGVVDDYIADTARHGGVDKACFLFGNNHYNFWQQKYPDLLFEYGMFGENVTLKELDESKLKIGDTLQLGEAVVQITQPRQPCYKMGIKFNNQSVVNQYRLSHTPGIYVRVLKEGKAAKNDVFTLIDSNANAPTVLETFRLIYNPKPDEKTLQNLINNPHTAVRLKQYLINKFNLA